MSLEKQPPYSKRTKEQENLWLKTTTRNLMKAALKQVAAIPEYQKALANEHLNLRTGAAGGLSPEQLICFESEGSKFRLSYRTEIQYNDDPNENDGLKKKNIYE